MPDLNGVHPVFWAFMEALTIGVVTIVGYIVNRRSIAAQATADEAEAKAAGAQASVANSEAVASLITDIRQFGEMLKEERLEAQRLSARNRELEEQARLERKRLQDQIDDLNKKLFDADEKHAQQLNEMRDAHKAEIDNIRSDMQKTHKTEVDTLMRNHKAEMAQLESNHGEMVASLQEQLRLANEQIDQLKSAVATLTSQFTSNGHDNAAEAVSEPSTLNQGD